MMSVTAICLVTLLFQLLQKVLSSDSVKHFSIENGICESGETCQGCQFCQSGEICPNACVPGAACTFCPPSNQPTSQPPTNEPTSHPSISPTISIQPTLLPTTEPTLLPSCIPSLLPTTTFPSSEPSAIPTDSPLYSPTSMPSMPPTTTPSVLSTDKPSKKPSFHSSYHPSIKPSHKPSKHPLRKPSEMPSTEPSTLQSLTTFQPSIILTQSPITCIPSVIPSLHSIGPSCNPRVTTPGSSSNPTSSSSRDSLSNLKPRPSSEPTPVQQPMPFAAKLTVVPSTKPFPFAVPTSSPGAVATTQTSSTVISISVIITLLAACGGICVVIGAIILYKRFRSNIEKENKLQENDNNSNLSYKHGSRSGKSNELNPYYFSDSQSLCDEGITDRAVQLGLRQSIHTTQDTQEDLEWNASLRVRSSPYMSPRSPHLLGPNRPLSCGLNSNTSVRYRPRTSIDWDRIQDREEANKHSVMGGISSKSLKSLSSLFTANRDLDTDNNCETDEKAILRSQSCRSLFTGVSGLTTGSSKSPRQYFATATSRNTSSVWNSPVITKSSDLGMGQSLSAKSRIGSCTAKLTRLRDQRQRIEATFALSTDDDICVADELRLYKRA